ncbi:MAG: hypothetical protein QOG43_2519 [Actinomycetota bacterium]|jgi:hypothetical protein|nr:hypothetical protein [Actinomycetota bacterium]
MADTVGPETEDGRESELAALDDLATAVDANARDQRRLAGLIRRLRTSRAAGGSWKDLLTRQPQPGVLGLTAQILRGVADASGTLRRQLARGLRAEGVTIPAIAAMFGVSHQRVSALLRRGNGSPPI